MQYLAYILIDSLFLIVALAIAWFSIKSLVRSVESINANWRNMHRHGATRIQESMPARLARDTHVFECHIVTPITEPQDWQIYDSPTYLRRGILIH
jgi:hypothetical protein